MVDPTPKGIALGAKPTPFAGIAPGKMSETRQSARPFLWNFRNRISRPLAGNAPSAGREAGWALGTCEFLFEVFCGRNQIVETQYSRRALAADGICDVRPAAGVAPAKRRFDQNNAAFLAQNPLVGDHSPRPVSPCDYHHWPRRFREVHRRACLTKITARLLF